jgi:hypothetical protein
VLIRVFPRVAADRMFDELLGLNPVRWL